MLTHYINTPFKKAISCALLATLPGCANFSTDGGFNTVKTLVSQSIGQQPVWWRNNEDKQAVHARVEALLAEPLSADSAVQLALINNPQLQSDLYGLLLAESNQVQASLVANPNFAMLYAKHAGDYSIERSLTINILSLLFRGQRIAIAEDQFEASKQRAALDVLTLAQKARQMFISSVTAKQKAHYLMQACNNAKATFTLASRMQEAGNWSTLDQARVEASYLSLVLQQQQAENVYVQLLEQLTRTLGLKDRSLIQLPEMLLPLPKADQLRQPNLNEAISQRIDLQQAKWQSEALAKQLGLTNTTRWADAIEIGPATVLEGDRSATSKKGIDLSLSIPIFDQGQANLKQAEANYQQFVLHAKSLAISAASEIRAQYQQYKTSYTIAKRYQEEILPLNQTLVDESLLRYNGMLMSPFELMQTARNQVMVMNEYLEALQRFWLADSQLTLALVGPIQGQGD